MTHFELKGKSVYPSKSRKSSWVVAHAFNPSTQGGRGRQISEFKASLVYRVRVDLKNKQKQVKEKRLLLVVSLSFVELTENTTFPLVLVLA